MTENRAQIVPDSQVPTGRESCGNWLLFTSATFIESAPRYALTLFPIFVLFALLAASRFWNAVIIVWSLLFLALFASLFV